MTFVAEEGGFLHLFRLESGSTSRLTSGEVNHSWPSVAAGRIVYGSDRDGGHDIYYSALGSSVHRRITLDPASDVEPALHPLRGSIVFVSYRSGTPRLWLTDTLGSETTALPTGSDSFTPERAPKWSPDGEWIAFISARTGTSQVWLMPAAGGQALQLSRESAGAFEFTWSPDGDRIIYMTPSPQPRLRSVGRDGMDSREFASAPEGLGHPSCGAIDCVALLRPQVPGAGTLVRIGDGGAVRAVAGAPVGLSHPALER